MSSGSPRRPVTVHFVTLGCPKNEVDSDRMAARLTASRFAVSDSLEGADAVVVNTCGFITDAAEESVAEILDLAEWRDAAPDRSLIVAGCLVSRYGDELADALTEADAFVPVAEESRIAHVLAELSGQQADPDARASLRHHVGPSAYLQVSDGCHRSCAYCTIPSIRGPYRSRDLASIELEARELVAGGAREIVLIGQDISAYGHDLDASHRLPDVIRTVTAVPGLEWLRLMYVQPDGITDELIATMAEDPKVCAYLDMPLQHASERVLRSMRRRGSAEEFSATVARLREAIPDIVVRTTFIAGFPGETRADVSLLLRFIEETSFDYVGVFPYSPEEGTAAAMLPDLPATRTRLRRAQRVRDVADGVGTRRAAALVGRTLEVLGEGVDEDGGPVGRWRGQAPEIDGVVLLDREIPVGRIARVKITDSLLYDLEGEVIE